MSSSSLDSLKRASSSASHSRASQRRSWLLLPALLAGFALLSFFLFGERLRPRLEVETAPALLVETSEGDTTEPSKSFSQASGWIEPDPYPIHVPVRVDGLVETVDVLEGESVKKGQLLATMDPVDFEFSLRSLEGSLQAAKAQQLEKEASVIRADAEHRRAQAGVTAAEARLAEQEDRLRRVLALDEGVVPEDDRLQVEREVAVGQADLAAAKAEMEGHMAHMKVEKAGVQMASANVTELIARVERAETDLARTHIYSPMDGVVMYRYVTPGGKRMRGMDDSESVTIVSLYDPKKLQVRVDVPLADAAGVLVDMQARIQLSAFPNQTFSGVVTRIVGKADIVRNTLQVKVAIKDPDLRMRPEMLCRVEFLSAPKLGNTGSLAVRASENVWIPEAAIQEGTKAWVVDPVTQRVELREVEVGTETREGYQVIMEGLRPGERVVLNNPVGLKPGERVTERKGDDS